ncbi:MAG: hypothetical protein ACI4VB_11205 [Bradymonadia bacterium]
MLLRCSQCQNTFYMDEQAYAAQGGAMCEQCRVPLIPVAEEGAQWGQQSPVDAQWGQQPGAQWGQQSPANAQWGQQPGAQWGQQSPANAQWGQQPGAQWGQQPPADAQWGQQPPVDAQWGQQPPVDAQWGQQPPVDAQWGQQPPVDAQWGQQPPVDAQWGQMADQPKETIALTDAIEPCEVVRHDDANERTVALADWDSNSIPQMPVTQANAPQNDGWGAWGQPEDNPPTQNVPAISANKDPHAIVVGRELPPGANEGMTRQIDVRAVQEMYGDKINPLKAFFRSLPRRYLIMAGGALGVAVIVFVVVAYAITRPPKVEKVIREDGEVVDAGTPEREKTFADLAKESRDLSAAFIPFDGPLAQEGSIVAIDDAIGVRYDLTQIASVQDISSGAAYVPVLADAAKDNSDKPKPITLLFAESLSMSSIYRVMYSLATTNRPLSIGGTAHNGIATFNLTPCGWPDHGLYIFQSCKDVKVEVKITRANVTMRRLVDADTIPIALLPDGTKLTEVKADIVGNKIQFESLNDAISRLRAKGTTVQLTTDGDVSFGVFLQIARKIYGSYDNPNVRQLYIASIPLM